MFHFSILQLTMMHSVSNHGI